MKESWTREELRQALIKFDKEYGRYPEHESEGFAIWSYLMGTEYVNWDPEFDKWETEVKKGV